MAVPISAYSISCYSGSAVLLNSHRFKGEAKSFQYCHFADIAIDDEMKL